MDDGNIHGTPEPPDPYRTENAFPKLKFFEPLSVGLVPGNAGANRFGVATRPGKIYTFEIRPDVEQSRPAGRREADDLRPGLPSPVRRERLLLSSRR